MPIPDYGLIRFYCGPKRYWFEDRRASDWNIESGEKGKVIPIPRIDRGEHKYYFYPLKWKGFCFKVTEEQVQVKNDY